MRPTNSLEKNGLPPLIPDFLRRPIKVFALCCEMKTNQKEDRISNDKILDCESPAAGLAAKLPFADAGRALDVCAIAELQRERDCRPEGGLREHIRYGIPAPF